MEFHFLPNSMCMYISQIAHLRKTRLTFKTSHITPSSLLSHFSRTTPSHHATIPIHTHPKLRHPTTHPLSFSFHLDETITHIPQHPSLFPPHNKAIAIPMAVSSNTSIAPLAHTPSHTLQYYTHPLLHTLLYLLTALARHFTAIASCIACTSPPSTLR